MQTTTPKEFDYWVLLGAIVIFTLLLTMATTIALGVFDPVLWTVIAIPIALTIYAYRRCGD